MWFHIGVICIVLLFSALLFANGETNTNKKQFLWLAFIVLFIVSAFRSINVGSDTKVYASMFRLYGEANTLLDLNTRIELGYILYNRLLYWVYSEPIILFIVSSAFILGVQLKFIYRNTSLIWLSVLLFINLRLYYFTLNGLRQSIAMAIILLSYEYLKKKRLFPFVLVVCIASLFHYTAVIFLFMYPLSKIKFSRKLILIEMIIGVAIIGVFNIFIEVVLRFLPVYQSYLSSVYFDGQIQVASILNFLIAILIFLMGWSVKSYRLKLNTYEKREPICEKQFETNLLFHIIFLSAITSLIAIQASILSRVAYYFFMFAVIFIPKVVATIKNKNRKIIIIYLIFVISLANNIIVLIYRPEWQHVYPYEFFWQIRE